MAVSPLCQGQGIGRQLVLELERKAKECLFESIVLHARQVAFPFYEKLGYAFISDLFEEVGIPHRAMTKSLGDEK